LGAHKILKNVLLGAPNANLFKAAIGLKLRVAIRDAQPEDEDTAVFGPEEMIPVILAALNLPLEGRPVHES
jgi:hypothetical protein